MSVKRFASLVQYESDLCCFYKVSGFILNLFLSTAGPFYVQ